MTARTYTFLTTSLLPTSLCCLTKPHKTVKSFFKSWKVYLAGDMFDKLTAFFKERTSLRSWITTLFTYGIFFLLKKFPTWSYVWIWSDDWSKKSTQRERTTICNQLSGMCFWLPFKDHIWKYYRISRCQHSWIGMLWPTHQLKFVGIWHFFNKPHFKIHSI